MSIDAKFRADFTDFRRAVGDAEMSLRSFESGSSKVKTSLDRIGDSFSGRRVISEAELMVEAVKRLGGTATLTAAEMRKLGTATGEAIEKMKARGMEIPAGLRQYNEEAKGAIASTTSLSSVAGGLAARMAGAFTVGAVIGFGRAVLQAADDIGKMAAQTSMTIEEVQRLGHIAGQTSVSIDSLVKATQTLQQRLGDKNSGAAGALSDFNIEQAAFMKMGAYEQMALLSEKIRGIKDPAERAIVQFKLFGGTWREITPAMLEDFRKIGEAATVMSDSTQRSLDYTGDRLLAMGGILKGMGASMLAFVADWSSLSDVSIEAAKDFDGLKGAIAKIEPVAIKTAAALKVMAAPEGVDLKGITNALDVDIAKSTAENTKRDADAAAAKKKHADALTHLWEVGLGWKATIASMTEEEIKSIQTHIRQGAQVNQIAEAYGKTEAQIRGVAEGMKVADDAVTKSIAAITKANQLWAEHGEIRSRQGKTTNQEAMAEIDRWVAAQVKGALEAGIATDEFYEKLKANEQARRDDVNINWDTIRKARDESFDGLDAAAKNEEATLQYMRNNWQEYADGAIEEQERVATAARDLASGIADDMTAALDEVTAATSAAAASWADAMDASSKGGGHLGGILSTGGPFQGSKESIQKAHEAGRYWGPVDEYGDPDWDQILPKGKARGGQVDARSKYIVGERGPELFVPETGGAIMPNGSGGGGSTTITVNMSGLLLSNNPTARDELRRAVDDAVTASMKRSRKFSY